MAPSAPPAPMIVCSSSMKSTTLPAERISFITRFRRSSNSPRYFVPATREARSRVSTRLPTRTSGTVPSTIFCASPSTMAVLPTPGSPMSTGLFFVRRARIWMTRWISFSRPITGSSLLSRANDGEVAAELVQRGRGLLRRRLRLLLARLRGGALVVAGAADLQDGLPQPVGGDVVPRQVAGHDASLLLDGGQQEVLGADVLVAHVAGLFGGILQDLLAALGGRDVAEDQAALALGQALLDLRLHLGDVHLDAQQRLDRDAFPVLQEGEDDVLGQELVGVEALGLLLREYGEHLLCPLRETLEHGVSLPSVA